MCYPRDELFLFSGTDARTRISGKLGSFYQQYIDSFRPFFEKISAIPFPIVIATFPDDGLKRVFEEQGVSFQFSYYHKKGTPKMHERITEPPTSHRILFNLFGKTGERDSLVLTHEDLFDYFKSILGSKPLSDDMYIHLSEALSESDDFIFLGFQFDRWYMQLLLRLLNPELSKGHQYAFNPELADETRVFFADQFKVDFVDEYSPMEFLNELHKRWLEYETAQAQRLSKKIHLRNMIKQGRIQDVLKQLEQEFQQEKNPEAQEEAFLLTSRLKDLTVQMREGIILTEHANIEKNKIRKGALELIDTVND